jgi:hypothetical protein
MLSLNVMLVVPHPNGQITTSDRFDRLVANGDATARGAVKIPAFWPFPSGTGIASNHDPTLRVGVSKSI